jgi:hypothetical protein
MVKQPSQEVRRRSNRDRQTTLYEVSSFEVIFNIQQFPHFVTSVFPIQGFQPFLIIEKNMIKT